MDGAQPLPSREPARLHRRGLMLAASLLAFNDGPRIRIAAIDHGK